MAFCSHREEERESKDEPSSLVVISIVVTRDALLLSRIASCRDISAVFDVFVARASGVTASPAQGGSSTANLFLGGTI